jgi:hypothetical protein
VNPGSLRRAITVNIVGSFDIVRGTRSLQPGAGVTLLGYVCALLGMLWLSSRPQTSRP